MKKAVVILMVLASSTIYARSPLRFGLKAGGQLSHLNISQSNAYYSMNNGFGFGGYAGGLLEVSGPAGSKLKGQLEALFNYQNFRNEYELLGNLVNTTQRTALTQISLPLMIRYFPIPSLSINAGGFVQFNLAADAERETEILGIATKTTENFKDNDYLQPVQAGVLAGVTYYIYKGFFVDGRYNYAFGSMLQQKQNNDPRYMVSTIQLGVGYKF